MRHRREGFVMSGHAGCSDATAALPVMHLGQPHPARSSALPASALTKPDRAARAARLRHVGPRPLLSGYDSPAPHAPSDQPHPARSSALPASALTEPDRAVGAARLRHVGPRGLLTGDGIPAPDAPSGQPHPARSSALPPQPSRTRPCGTAGMASSCRTTRVAHRRRQPALRCAPHPGRLPRDLSRPACQNPMSSSSMS